MQTERFRVTPTWLKVMIKTSFFETCLLHSIIKKSELNYYCSDCSCALCNHCLVAHGKHKLLQVRRYMYQDVINLQDMRKLMNCSGIQAYRTNSAKVLFLKRRTVVHSKRGHGILSVCLNCERQLQQEQSQYCSIACKVAIVYDKNRPKLQPKQREGGEEKDPSNATMPMHEEETNGPNLDSPQALFVHLSSSSPSDDNTISTPKKPRHRRKGIPLRSPLH